MTTATEIGTRALRRLGVIDVLETPAAEQSAAALAALNEMLAGWVLSGVDVLHTTLIHNSLFGFFVPPRSLTSAAIAAVTDAGNWDADTNTPTLASATGTAGTVYKVSVAGSISLDGLASWAVGDYLVYSGTAWLKAPSSARFDGGTIALLALRLSDDFGVAPTDQLRIDARNASIALRDTYVRSPTATIDAGLMTVPSMGAFSGGVNEDE